MFVTLAVLKVLRLRLGRLLQPENIKFISVTFSVLKVLRLRLGRLLQW